MSLKNRERQIKTEGWTAPKSRGCSLAVGTYLQRGSAPHPSPCAVVLGGGRSGTTYQH